MNLIDALPPCMSILQKTAAVHDECYYMACVGDDDGGEMTATSLLLSGCG